MMPGSRSFWLLLACMVLGSIRPTALCRAQSALETLSREKATADEKIAALKRVWQPDAAPGLGRDAVREAVKRLVWRGSEKPEVRCAAVDALLAEPMPDSDPTASPVASTGAGQRTGSEVGGGGEADTANMVRLMLPTEGDWKLLEHVCRLAADRGWTQVTPSLIRSLARVVPDTKDENRPEYKALLALYPGRPVEEVAFEVFVTPVLDDSLAKDVALKAPAEAWQLLTRLDPDASKRKEFIARYQRGELGATAPGAVQGQGTPAENEMLAVLVAGSQDLGVVPLTAEQLTWLRELRRFAASPAQARDDSQADVPSAQQWWERVREVVAGLTPAQRDRFSLRHCEPARWAAENRPEWMALDRDALLSLARERLMGRQGWSREAGVGADTSATDFQRDISYWGPRACWGDLLAILVIDDALASDAVRRALFEQTAKDRKDTSTEYGGVLYARSQPDNTFSVRLFPPRATQRTNDQRFIASDEMVTFGARGLADYHFHVQKAKNRQYAGPSNGDLDYARTHGRSCIVFTAIDEKTLNADFYVADGLVVDLGPILAPSH